MRKDKVKLKCGNCGHINVITPPRKYLKKTWFIVINCESCGKKNNIGFYFGKLRAIVKAEGEKG